MGSDPLPHTENVYLTGPLINTWKEPELVGCSTVSLGHVPRAGSLNAVDGYFYGFPSLLPIRYYQGCFAILPTLHTNCAEKPANRPGFCRDLARDRGSQSPDGS